MIIFASNLAVGIFFGLRSINSSTPFSQATVTYIALSASRNGSTDFYNTPSLRAFVQAVGIQVALQGHYYDNILDVRHQYYGIYEITVSGRYVYVHLSSEWSVAEQRL